MGMKRSDINLFVKACKEGWDIPPKVRAEKIAELREMLNHSDFGWRMRAMQALVAIGEIEPEKPAESKNQRDAQRQQQETAAAQEIGPLPEPKDPQRRERASNDNLLFAETYFPKTFFMGWAPYQRRMMDRFQGVLTEGGKECHAVRRGGLKSTCARVSTIWGTVNGHVRFPVLVGATDPKANEHRENFFAMLRSSETLLEDYPELLPLLLKKKQPKKQFRLDGQLLEVHHKDDKGRIVFPNIEGAVSDETHIAPYSVNATDVSGLAFVDRHGVTVRPDALIFDDVQTPQSARSPSQTSTRESNIVKVFGGLEGMTEDIPAIMVCTVREHDCLTMRFLNRELHPDWDGYRYPSIISMPDNLELWDIYAQKLAMGATADDGKRLAREFYLANFEEMNAGAVVAWDKDITPPAVDSLQSLMTVRATKPDYFETDIQQNGVPPADASGVKLESKLLQERVSGIPRGTVPDQSSYLTAFVDSSDEVLWWMVCAWQTDFTGWIVDYGTWPNQGRPQFLKRDLVKKITQEMPGHSWEEAFVNAHNKLDDELLETEWFTESGEARKIDLLLKDWSDGEHKKRIQSQVLASLNRTRIRPSKGIGQKPNRKPVHAWGDDYVDRDSGEHWVERRGENPMHVQYDVNIWKTHAARRLLTIHGASSAVLFPGNNGNSHSKLVDHFTAETPRSVTVDGSSGTMWDQPDGVENDWWDCFVGNTTAASMLGCQLKGEKAKVVEEPRTFSLPGL